MEYFKDCKTAQDARTLFRKLAKELHPDTGGSHAQFIELKKQFENFRPFNFEGNDKYFKASQQKDIAEIIEQLITIEGINIDVVGTWVWLSGNTKPVKDQIKAVKAERYNCRWHKGKKMWYFSPKGYRKTSGKKLTYEQIKEFYGCESVNSQGAAKITT